MRNKLLLYITLFTIATNVWGQTEKPFSSVAVILKGVYTQNQNIINDYWKSEFGGEIMASTPFYAGYLDIGIQYLPFSGESEKYVNFSSMFISLGWGMNMPIVKNLDLFLGAKFGTSILDFDNSALSAFEKSENEFTIATFGRLLYSVNGNILFTLGADYSKIFLTHEIKLLTLNGGIGFKFSTSNWFRELVK